jgi:predicted neutral ceramidase superfamily lipid hydrolase
MIGSEETLSAAQVDADRATISAWLARAEVRDELVAMGVSPAEVEARVAALGDDEIRDLAGTVGTAPAGAGIVGALVFVFVVLLVTDILGLTKVFPFTRSVR